MAAAVAQRVPNLVGIKDSSGDLTNTLDYMQRCPPGFRVFVGRDTLVYAALCCGCTGAVAATANVAPELVVGIYNAYQAGDMAGSIELQHRLDPLRHAFSLGSFPVVVKDAMELLGLPAGRCWAPISSLSGAPREKLISILQGMGKL
jgi:4-hydroxy-tetrahydrodipicolinate synthase